MARQIIEDNDIAWLQKRDKLGFNPGLKALPINRAIEHPRRVDPVQPQPGHKGQRLPPSLRHIGLQRKASPTPAAHPRHVCLEPSFIHKNKASGIDPMLVCSPARPEAGRSGPGLLLCEHGFFYSSGPRP